MSRILSQFARWAPRLIIGTGLAYGYYQYNFNSYLKPQKVNCFTILPSPHKPLNFLVGNVIRIVQNDSIVGYAYCFMDNYLVSVSLELFQMIKKKTPGAKLENVLKFYQGENQIKGKLQVVGQFQNLTFLRLLDGKLKPLPSSDIDIISPVQIVQKRSYLSVKDGYYVANEGGFGIIDGKGQIGSFVSNKGNIVGLITHVGRDSERGFLRMVIWRNLINVSQRLMKKQPVYLGISVRAREGYDQGVTVVRVSADSPLKDYLILGDCILKVNGSQINQPSDLLRSVMMSPETVEFTVETFDKRQKTISVQL